MIFNKKNKKHILAFCQKSVEYQKKLAKEEVAYLYFNRANAPVIPFFRFKIFYELNDNLEVIINENKTLDSAKPLLRKEINRAKHTEQELPVEFNGNYFQSGEKSRNKFKIAIEYAEKMDATEGTIWDINDNPIVLSHDDAYALLTKIEGILYFTKSKEQQLKIDIKNATTITELIEIKW